MIRTCDIFPIREEGEKIIEEENRFQTEVITSPIKQFLYESIP